METRLDPGSRCRATRQITHASGVLRRRSEGTVLARRENIGRQLFTVGFDDGAKLVLFAHEIEPVSDVAA